MGNEDDKDENKNNLKKSFDYKTDLDELGVEIDTIQRITGYLVGTTSRWNNAKLSELKDRVTHTGLGENTIKGA